MFLACSAIRWRLSYEQTPLPYATAPMAFCRLNDACSGFGARSLCALSRTNGPIAGQDKDQQHFRIPRTMLSPALDSAVHLSWVALRGPWVW
jgi:hypothetical protein